MLPLVAVLPGCSEPKQPAAPPPAFVEVVTVAAEAVPNIVELPGRIEAVRTAEVRPRTDGIIQRRLFEEGTFVREGTPLFLIDPRDYRAQVQSARAVLERAAAARTNAAAVVRRYEPLVSRRAVSGQEFDAARSELRQAEAQVSEARAGLSRAELLLSYTTVRAPISGRVGRAEVTEGALVSATQTNALTRIDQTTPVYAVFTVSSAEILNAGERARSGEVKVAGLNSVTVKLTLENGTTYGPAGRLDFTGATVAPETGTQLVRAQFPNPEGTLKPGEFVRGRLEAGTIANGIAIPSRSVQFRGEQASVSVLQQDGSVVSRPVTLGEMIGKRWIVRSGLRAGERVITEGWNRVRAGGKAQVKPAGGAASVPAGAAPAPATAGGQPGPPSAGAPTKGN
ncbi:efflux RND transporter periplasmic adaptor subunit [Sphingomonas faeni]|uniref:efflux RND transporter periplasmic adaptor subunit n=1 Tax=Sphingomonas faeni TaxID=185950 RepID=UPI002780F2F8|nr:efflux RND transporter periplasmic adaptor subunit [Sphingomonas faeni]MDQ0839985.1 membrane fusion protein (multidrug efflux system) [Sphingomonas faeni]